jgi:hypothetical protein
MMGPEVGLAPTRGEARARAVVAVVVFVLVAPTPREVRGVTVVVFVLVAPAPGPVALTGLIAPAAARRALARRPLVVLCRHVARLLAVTRALQHGRGCPDDKRAEA